MSQTNCFLRWCLWPGWWPLLGFSSHTFHLVRHCPPKSSCRTMSRLGRTRTYMLVFLALTQEASSFSPSCGKPQCWLSSLTLLHGYKHCTVSWHPVCGQKQAFQRLQHTQLHSTHFAGDVVQLVGHFASSQRSQDSCISLVGSKRQDMPVCLFTPVVCTGASQLNSILMASSSSTPWFKPCE